MAEIDPESGDLRMWKQDLEEIEVPPVEEGAEPTLEMKVLGEEEVEVTDDFKGRIGAQTAKQVIFQKLRDAEREMTYEEFAGREGDVVTGIVQQQERRYTLLDLGKVEALLPQAEQVPTEPYRHGERLKAYITEVRKGTKGPQIVVSRSHPGLLKALFAMEVPEVEEGIVEIRAVAREPGHRSKIGVLSNEPGCRPRGRMRRARRARACAWSSTSSAVRRSTSSRGRDNSAEFVANALQPAKVREVRIDEETGTAMVIVPDYQLSLAIGKEGQNARLAARSDRLAHRHQVRDAGRQTRREPQRRLRPRRSQSQSRRRQRPRRQSQSQSRRRQSQRRPSREPEPSRARASPRRRLRGE